MLNELVALKVNGKTFACTNRPRAPASKKKCGSKDFVLDPLAKSVTYACAACCSLITSAPGHVVEALLPFRNDWATPGGSVFKPEPGGLFTTLHNEYGFNLDLAADAVNTKCPVWLNESNDALRGDWFGMRVVDRVTEILNNPGISERVKTLAMSCLPVHALDVKAFANPPYRPTGTVGVWLKKAIEQCEKGVWSGWLIPMTSSVGWFAEYVIPFGQWSTFEGRIPFLDPLATDEENARSSPRQDNLWVVFDPAATFSGHVAHRSAKTGEYIWRRNA